MGRWRIVEMELWDESALDLVGPAHLTLKRGGTGELAFIAISAGVDYRAAGADGSYEVEFCWDGVDEGDRVSGRGRATVKDDEMRGRLYIFAGDDSSFVAERS